MKKLAILCGIVAALLCLTQNASAQYARKGANIVDKSGYVLSDSQIVNLVGQNVGARKQYKSGRKLIWGGILGGVAGFAGTVYSFYRVQQAGYTVEQLEQAFDNDATAKWLYYGSSALTSVGGTAFSAGIILKTIGKKRLNWVEDQANAAKGYSLNVGATQNGLGLTLQF